jgi:hypothetical protein
MAMLVTACSTMDHERVEGWPELQIVEHHVPAPAMLERCRKYAGFGSVPLACAEFNLVARRCDIWLSEGFALSAIVEHERLHCRGYDHVGATNMRDFLARYQAATGATREGVAAARAAD